MAMDLKRRDHADRRAGWHLGEVAPTKRTAHYLGVSARRVQQIVRGSPKGLVQDFWRFIEQLSEGDALALIQGAREHAIRVTLYRADDAALRVYQHDTCHAETEIEGPLNIAQSRLRANPNDMDALRAVSTLAPRQSRKLDALAAAATERLRRADE